MACMIRTHFALQELLGNQESADICLLKFCLVSVVVGFIIVVVLRVMFGNIDFTPVRAPIGMNSSHLEIEGW